MEEDLSVCQGAADLAAIIIVIMTWYEGLSELTNLLSFHVFLHQNELHISSDFWKWWKDSDDCLFNHGERTWKIHFKQQIQQYHQSKCSDEFICGSHPQRLDCDICFLLICQQYVKLSYNASEPVISPRTLLLTLCLLHGCCLVSSVINLFSCSRLKNKVSVEYGNLDLVSKDILKAQEISLVKTNDKEKLSSLQQNTFF